MLRGRSCSISPVRRLKNFERNRVARHLTFTMTKLIALVAAGMLATGALFAGGHGDCAKQVGHKEKMACQVSLASLNLTAEQKTKMDAAMAEHEKAGCTEASEAKYEQAAKSILTKDQFAKFEAECKHGKKDTQT